MSMYEIPQDRIVEMQAVGLEMAKFFDGFCARHNLTYFFCGGCCIGALRNGGFIPWDDDVDIFMPRRDYERLKELWQDTEQYEMQYTERHFNCRRPFITIHDKNTTFIETYRRDMDISHGVSLDILPLDGCPTGWRRKTQKLWALAFSLFNVGSAPENHGGAVTALGKLALALLPAEGLRYRVWRLCEKKMTQYPIEDCGLITELCSGPHYMQKEYPSAAFAAAVRREFEGYMFPLPVGYHEYLSLAFGDYMALPPEEKRVNHHAYEHMDMHTPYRAYRGIYYCREK